MTEFLILFALTIPVVMLTWAILDLTHSPTKTKALLKIVLGTILTVIMLQYSNRAIIATVLACIGLVVALLGVADMTACRTREKN